MTAPHFYAITPAETLVAAGHAARTLAAPGVPAPDRLPTYGEVRTPSPGNQPFANPVHRYVFHDATVHGPEGVVTVGRHAVLETLLHVSPRRSACLTDGTLWLAHDHYPGGVLAGAEHLLTGNPGNYFHWLLDGVARGCLAPGAGPVLLSSTGFGFQREAACLPGITAAARFLAPGQSLQVRRLAWTTSLTAMGGAFHPALHRVRDAAAPAGPADIYVARTDAIQRPLRNEDAVLRLCAARGFTPVVLAGMPLAKQAGLFAAARRIVAPHGAGLANLVFTRSGAALLELTMDHYANLCFRRLAACMGVGWGCVVGRAEPGGDPDWVHGTGWTLDLDRLAAALDDPAFAPKEPP